MALSDRDLLDDWHRPADEVISYLPNLHDRFAKHLADLVGIPAVSARDGDLIPAAEALAAVMRACGLATSLESTSGAPVVLGSYATSSNRPTVIVYGHYDVQPAEPLDAWDTDPFTLAIRNGRFIGRGTSDNKAQHLAQLMAIRAMLDVHGTLPVNVHVVVEGGEEVGSPHLGDWLLRNEARLDADFALASDGALHTSGRPVIVAGARGLVYLDVRLTVCDTDRHSGNFGGIARNAATELARALATLWDDNGRVLVDGFADAVAPDRVARRAITRLPLEAGALAAQGIRGTIQTPQQWFDHILLQPSLNLCGFEAGWTGPSMKTIVPGTARAKLDARLVPNQSPNAIATLVRDHLQRTCSDIEVSTVGVMDPSRTPLDLPFVNTVTRAVAHAWGQDPLVYPNLAGSLPVALFARLGIPSVIVPYGNADQRNHAPNENMSISNFHAGARVLVSVLHALVGQAVAR